MKNEVVEQWRDFIQVSEWEPGIEVQNGQCFLRGNVILARLFPMEHPDCRSWAVPGVLPLLMRRSSAPTYVDLAFKRQEAPTMKTLLNRDEFLRLHDRTGEWFAHGQGGFVRIVQSRLTPSRSYAFEP